MMRLRGIRAVVTGGAGFIGSHIVDSLLSENDVVVVDDFSTGKEENLIAHGAGPRFADGDAEPIGGVEGGGMRRAEGFAGPPAEMEGEGGSSGRCARGPRKVPLTGEGARGGRRRGREFARRRGLIILRGSVTDEGLLRLALRDADVVFHLAAIPGVPASVRDPAGTARVNLMGTLAVLEAARHCGVSKVIFSSSCAVYGDARPPVSETTLPCPKSPYAVQKLAGEHLCRVYHELHGLKTVCLRLFNVFGPRQDPESEYAAVIPRFVKDMRERGRVTIFGDGRQTRDFIYVGDVVRATLLAAERSSADGRVVNVATGKGTSVSELARELAAVLGLPLRVRRASRREGDIRHSWADTTLAQKVLGFRACVPLRRGLRALASALPC